MHEASPLAPMMTGSFDHQSSLHLLFQDSAWKSVCAAQCGRVEVGMDIVV